MRCIQFLHMLLKLSPIHPRRHYSEECEGKAQKIGHTKLKSIRRYQYVQTTILLYVKGK